MTRNPRQGLQGWCRHPGRDQRHPRARLWVCGVGFWGAVVRKGGPGVMLEQPREARPQCGEPGARAVERCCRASLGWRNLAFGPGMAPRSCATSGKSLTVPVPPFPRWQGRMLRESEILWVCCQPEQECRPGCLMHRHGCVFICTWTMSWGTRGWAR